MRLKPDNPLYPLTQTVMGYMLSNTETLNRAIELLKSLNCPEPIIDALWVFSLVVHDENTKLKNWNAWSKGQLIEGEAIAIVPAIEPIRQLPSASEETNPAFPKASLE